MSATASYLSLLVEWFSSCSAVHLRECCAEWVRLCVLSCVLWAFYRPVHLAVFRRALTLIRNPFSVHYAGPLGRPQQIRTISPPLTSSLKLKWHSLHPTCHTHMYTYWPVNTHKHRLLNVYRCMHHKPISHMNFHKLSTLQEIHLFKKDAYQKPLSHTQTHMHTGDGRSPVTPSQF